MRKFRIILSLILIAVLAMIFVACGETNDNDGTTDDGTSGITISFDTQGGSEMSPLVIRAGETVTIPCEPTKEGFIFDGWYLDADFANSFNIGEPINGDIVLYAKWKVDDGGQIEKPTYTIFFDTLGGNEIAPLSISEGAAIVLPQNPTREGFIFEGWYLSVEFVDEFDVTAGISSDITLFAKWVQDKCSHDFTIVDAGVEPTCTMPGLSDGSHCVQCEEVIVERQVIPPLGHDYSVYNPKIEPTCVIFGNEEYYSCSRCGLRQNYVEIPALGHDLHQHDAKEQTCTESGCNAYEDCSRCDYTTYVELPALGHDEIYHNAKEPSCTEVGWYDYFDCSRCGEYTTYVERPAMGHNKHYYEAKEQTCTEQGWDAYYACDRCDYSTRVILPALGHNCISFEKQEPTCTTAGHEKYEACTRCDYSTFRAIEALGHDERHFDAKQPTCTDDGWDEYDACSRCDYSTQVILPALGHECQSFEGKEATCTEAGFESYEACIHCDYTTFKAIAALGHDRHHFEAKDATCTESGWDEYDACSRCEYTTRVIVPALGHDYKHFDAVDATCSDTGVAEHYGCGRCEELFDINKAEKTIEDITVAINPDAHDFGAWEKDPSADTHSRVCAHNSQHVQTQECIGGNVTCTEKAVCEVCNARYGEPLGHYIVAFDGLKPTCEETGLTAGEYCDRENCDYVKDIEPIKALGHDMHHFDEKEPTCTEFGWKAYDACSRCDKATYIEIPAKGHKYTSEKSITCSVCGNDSRYDYEYLLNEDETGYVVKSIGTSTSKVLRVLENYKGLPVVEIAARAFENADIIEAYIPSSVTIMGEGAFSGCSNLQILVLPFVGNRAGAKNTDTEWYPFGYVFGSTQFENSYVALQDVKYGNMTNPDEIPYYIPEALHTVAITGGSILIGAFENCKSLKELYFADMLVPLEHFCETTEKTTVRISERLGITFGEVDYIAENSLAGCSSLEVLGLPFVGKRLNDADISSATLKYSPLAFMFGTEIYDNSIQISAAMSSSAIGNNGYIKYYVPSGLNVIGIARGKICSFVTSGWIDTSLKFMYFGENVTEFGQYSFLSLKVQSYIPYFIIESLDWLKGLAISTEGLVDQNVFAGDTRVYGEIFEENLIISLQEYNCLPLGIFKGQSQIRSITGSSSAAARIAKDCGSPYLDIVITDEEKTISSSAFANLDSIRSVVIEDGVTEIGISAFAGCANLERITIPFVGGKSGVESTGTNQYPFGYIFGKSSYVGGVETKQSYYLVSTSTPTTTSYYIPASLKSVTVTSGNILYGAFYNCTTLTEVVIGDRVTSIEKYAFYNCTGLTSITVPEGVATIKSSAFFKCTTLTTVNWNALACERKGTVLSRDPVFDECNNISTINIGGNVTSIPSYAFAECYNLTTINYNGTMEQWNAISKGDSWNASTGNYTIICTDGEINK